MINGKNRWKIRKGTEEGKRNIRKESRKGLFMKPEEVIGKDQREEKGKMIARQAI